MGMRGDSDSAGPLAGSQRHRALAHAAARDLSVLVNCLFYCDALNVKLVFLPNFESLIDETADPSADRQLLIRRHPRRCPVPFGSVPRPGTRPRRVFILVRTPGKSSVRVVPSLASSREHATRSDVQGVPASIAALDHRANRHMSPWPVPDLLRLSRRRHDPCEWPPGLGSAQPDRMPRDRRERPRRGGLELDNWERGRRLFAAPAA